MRVRLPSIPIRIMILALIAAGLVQVASDQIVLQIARAIAACSLVFVLPGYAVVTAFLPLQASDRPDRFVLIIGTSLAISILGGFVLNWTSTGLNTSSWLVLLSGITAIASLIAIRHHSPSSSAQSGWTRTSLSELRPLLQRAGLFGLAVLITVIAFVAARDAALKNPGPGFTQLWFLPVENEPQSVQLGLSNREARPMDYRLLVKGDGRILYEWPDIQLVDGQSWETSILLTLHSADSTEVLLYRLDSPDSVYRRVTIRSNPPQS